MSIVFINPGSGPVEGASLENATDNVAVFAEELGADFWEIAEASEDGGRWSAVLRRGGHESIIEMPGLPLDRVRYMGVSDQNIWDFPRLYVDGWSWVWCYALGVVWPEGDDNS